MFALEPNDGGKWGSWMLGVFTLDPNDGGGVVLSTGGVHSGA